MFHVGTKTMQRVRLFLSTPTRASITNTSSDVRSGKRWCVPRQDTYPEKRKNQIGTDSELVQRDIDLEAGLGADGLLVGGTGGVIAAL